MFILINKIASINKNIWILCAIILGISLSILAYIFTIDKKVDPYETVIVVNVEPVAIGEFNLFLSDNRAEVFGYISKKYNVQDSKDFWIKSFNGEVPIEILREKAIKNCIEIKIQQAMAKDKGLIDDISYAAFIKTLEDENIKRKEEVEKGQVIFGPQQYGEREFYDYLFSNMVIKLQDKLNKNELKVSNIELKDYYIKNRDKYFKIKDDNSNKNSLKTSNDFQTFNEVKNNIYSKIIEIKYDEMVKILVKNVIVDVDLDVLQKSTSSN